MGAARSGSSSSGQRKSACKWDDGETVLDAVCAQRVESIRRRAGGTSAACQRCIRSDGRGDQVGGADLPRQPAELDERDQAVGTRGAGRSVPERGAVVQEADDQQGDRRYALGRCTGLIARAQLALDIPFLLLYRQFFFPCLCQISWTIVSSLLNVQSATCECVRDVCEGDENERDRDPKIGWNFGRSGKRDLEGSMRDHGQGEKLELFAW